MQSYPKRLIEVDLPIKRISAHARREKSIRNGQISTLHIWWARRPLAACRAVTCAALWPDPADAICPESFRQAARQWMSRWAKENLGKLSEESYQRFITFQKNPERLNDNEELRYALLDFIADFANGGNSTVSEYLETSRALTQAAHEALGGAPGTRPLLVDPFAGGGSIPLEALRVGADAFASDLNSVAVLLNKVVLEYIPKYGHRLADEVRKWGEWIKREAEEELTEFYPKDADGATPIAYLWARTIQCEGPGCGMEVPLMRSLWLAKKGNRSVALQLVPNQKTKCVDFQIIVKQRDGWVDQANAKSTIQTPKLDGTVKRSSATCPCCGYTTPANRLREQVKARRGATNDARLYCIVTTHDKEQGRFFRLPSEQDRRLAIKAAEVLDLKRNTNNGPTSLVPDEPYPDETGSGAISSSVLYGLKTWGDLFIPRQLLTISTFISILQRLEHSAPARVDADLSKAIKCVLACAIDRLAEHATSLCRWNSSGPKMQATFGRQALPMMWDFCEANPFGGSVGSWESLLECVLIPFETCKGIEVHGQVERASATTVPLPDDAAQGFFTDPPYYDAIAYADLSDFFFVWLKRMLKREYPDLFSSQLVEKAEEAVQLSKRFRGPYAHKTKEFFEQKMKEAMREGRRVLEPQGIGIVVFAHKTTGGWESQLQAMVDAGWIITSSWPVDTEMGTRLNAMDAAVLASSVHLVCRPREKSDSSVRPDEIGDWRDVLQALPRRIHEWMPRLAEEGVVGADAIFACLGPALEIFSRYSRVEKASGETVTLKEYLEQVWAAVAKEALTIIFPNADTIGFEEDARLTAMWLWTLNAGNTDAANSESADGEEADDESEAGAKNAKTTGFVLEYDAARKIAQGLGAHLEDLGSLVEVSGDKARLLPVGERARHLFGKDEGHVAPAKKKKVPQLDLFKVLEQADGAETTSGEVVVERQGKTVLDRLHQSMILFAAGRSEAVKRFLVEEGVGRDPRFWSLAQAFSALYPTHTTEKRWIDGVLARKKGLGF
jgi:putative DNA methylase